ncbi:M23 family metallopeptidase [Galbitalea sp. SE-J8]|uniref:M23 family metallopeptidase n=1 Tax=Galbitalea sp. SE-J8 TaxID=3054952 RepID=UPI00259D0617|nr:M23 family metallopeptidase [Galbitalea sp. SE-J8]MDM4764431.1 M23 family metallopeptidase [Galbitalea sp. SE-J8]
MASAIVVTALLAGLTTIGLPASAQAMTCDQAHNTADPNNLVYRPPFTTTNGDAHWMRKYCADGWDGRYEPIGSLHTGWDWMLSPAPLSNGRFPVYALQHGEILDYSNDGSNATCMGRWVEVRQDDGVKVIYAHFDSISQFSGNINKSDQIGVAGKTGYCPTGTHIHLSMTMAWATNKWNSDFFNSKAFLVNHHAFDSYPGSDY